MPGVSGKGFKGSTEVPRLGSRLACLKDESKISR